MARVALELAYTTSVSVSRLRARFTTRNFASWTQSLSSEIHA